MPIAESLGLAALGWVASPVVKDLVTKSITYLGSDIAKGLEDLKIILLPQFQLTIQAAKNSPNATELKEWLDRLKIAYYDAEAILHELEYERLRHKVKSEQNKTWVRISSHPIIKPLIKFTTKVNKKVSLLSPQKKKLLKRLNSLKDVASEANNFRELLAVNTSNGNHAPVGDTRTPTSALLNNEVFGRDEVRDDIITFLLGEKESSSSTSHSVVTITGVGGAGKTTLAQYVYNDDRLKGHIKMWLCLSQNKDIEERIKEMIECISGEKSPDLHNLTLLQNTLREKLPETKAVLLVFDDVWYDGTIVEEEKWDRLLAPFASLGGRLKLIVTSRTQHFPVKLLPGLPIKLKDLADNDFLALFRYYAGLEISNSEMSNDKSDIGNQIAAKMNKSPLAAKVIGNQLRKQPNKIVWQDTLENVNLSDVEEILLWSYQRMDVQLQRCFLLFGTFTRGSHFTDYELVQYWVALDFIQPSDNKISAEDVGFEFFNLMLANSMLVKHVDAINGRYNIHDLFHELAKNLSVGDCFIVTDSESEIPSTTVRHVTLSVNNDNLKEKLSSISNLCNLRTLILENTLIEDVNETFSMISKLFKNLRVLEIWSAGYSELPKTVGNMRNLRYLNVYGSSIKELPDNVSQLYHLQYLLLPESVKTLPTTLRNLTRLRIIGMHDKEFTRVNAFPPLPDVGRLTSLKSLPEFHVRREKGYELQQLGHLREIGGSLRIVGLENVRDKDEALAARLMDKTELKEIKLAWTGSTGSIASEVDVIEALRPPTSLEGLKINGYRGSVYPTWLEEGSTLPYLQSVAFGNCNALKALPSSFGQFHHCWKLFLYNLEAMRELHAFPVNLAELSIRICPSLTLLHENELPLQVEDLQGRVVSGFLPSARYPWKFILEIEVESFEQICLMENCEEQLQIIKSAINTDNITSEQWEDIVRTAWWHCHEQRMKFISSGIARPKELKLPVRLCILELSYCCISDGALSDGLRGMASLQKLTLQGIMTITTLPPADVLQTLLSLHDLEILHCWCLRSLGGLHALPYLKELVVVGCWSLEMKNDDRALLPPTLQSVITKGSIISNNILCGKFQYLQEIIIHDCKVPDSLSFHHLNSLQTLRISYCSSLRLVKLSAVIDFLELVKLPNLDVQSVLNSWRGYRRLHISNSLMLNKLLLSQNFVGPKLLFLIDCEEETISIEKSVHLQSIKELNFFECKTKNLPATLRDFSDLEHIHFEDCPEISELPELPGSVHCIKIINCPVLRERCQPNGPDWHKIQQIEHKSHRLILFGS